MEFSYTNHKFSSITVEMTCAADNNGGYDKI